MSDYTLLRAKFDARLITKVAPFVAKGDIRYYLNGIRVEAAGDRPGVYIVGCDGNRLMVAYDANGMIANDDGQGIIIKAPPAFLAACLARSGKGRLPLDVLITGNRLSVAPGWGGMFRDTEVYVAPGLPFIEGKFPDWRKIMPDFSKLKPGIGNAVQGRYLADYAKVVSRDKWGSSAVRFWQETSGSPVVVQIPSYPELVGVLMPMSDDLPADALIAQMHGVMDTRREVAA